MTITRQRLDKARLIEYDDETEEFKYFDNFGNQLNEDGYVINPHITNQTPIADICDATGRLNVNLDENNFIVKYMRYASQLTDAYPEYHYATALSLLSIIANRKVVCKLSTSQIYPNLWIWALGTTSVAKKTTAMIKGEEFLIDCNINNRLVDYFSPEGLTEFLDSGSKCYLWLDEAGQMLANFQKPYMEDIKDMMCKLYDGRGYSKKNVTKKDRQSDFEVKLPYLTQFLMTTGEIFKSRTNMLDMTSGWLWRFLYFYPKYDKPTMDVRLLTDTDTVSRREITSLINAKLNIIKSLKENAEISMIPEPKVLDYLNSWYNKHVSNISKSQNNITGALVGRLQTYAIKLAMLFEIGENNWTTIRLKSIKEACRQADEYFIPNTKALIEEIDTNESKNFYDKIMGIINQSRGQIFYSVLLRKSKIDQSKLDNILNTLVASNQIVLEGKQKKLIRKIQPNDEE